MTNHCRDTHIGRVPPVLLALIFVISSGLKFSSLSGTADLIWLDYGVSKTMAYGAVIGVSCLELLTSGLLLFATRSRATGAATIATSCLIGGGSLAAAVFGSSTCGCLGAHVSLGTAGTLALSLCVLLLSALVLLR